MKSKSQCINRLLRRGKKTNIDFSKSEKCPRQRSSRTANREARQNKSTPTRRMLIQVNKKPRYFHSIQTCAEEVLPLSCARYLFVYCLRFFVLRGFSHCQVTKMKILFLLVVLAGWAAAYPIAEEIKEIPQAAVDAAADISPIEKVQEVAKSEVPEVAKSEVSEVAKSEVSEVSKSEVPEVAKSEVSEVAKSEVPEVAKSEVPEVAKSEVPEVAKSEVSEVAKGEGEVSEVTAKTQEAAGESETKADVPLEKKEEAEAQSEKKVIGVEEGIAVAKEKKETAENAVQDEKKEVQEAAVIQTKSDVPSETVEELKSEVAPAAAVAVETLEKGVELGTAEEMAASTVVEQVAEQPKSEVETAASNVVEQVAEQPKIETTQEVAEKVVQQQNSEVAPAVEVTSRVVDATQELKNEDSSNKVKSEVPEASPSAGATAEDIKAEAEKVDTKSEKVAEEGTTITDSDTQAAPVPATGADIKTVAAADVPVVAGSAGESAPVASEVKEEAKREIAVEAAAPETTDKNCADLITDPASRVVRETEKSEKKQKKAGAPEKKETEFKKAEEKVKAEETADVSSGHKIEKKEVTKESAPAEEDKTKAVKEDTKEVSEPVAVVVEQTETKAAPAVETKAEKVQEPAEEVAGSGTVKEVETRATEETAPPQMEKKDSGDPVAAETKSGDAVPKSEVKEDEVQAGQREEVKEEVKATESAAERSEAAAEAAPEEEKPHTEEKPAENAEVEAKSEVKPTEEVATAETAAENEKKAEES